VNEYDWLAAAPFLIKKAHATNINGWHDSVASIVFI